MFIKFREKNLAIIPLINGTKRPAIQGSRNEVFQIVRSIVRRELRKGGVA